MAIILDYLTDFNYKSYLDKPAEMASLWSLLIDNLNFFAKTYTDLEKKDI